MKMLGTNGTHVRITCRASSLSNIHIFAAGVTTTYPVNSPTTVDLVLICCKTFKLFNQKRERKEKSELIETKYENDVPTSVRDFDADILPTFHNKLARYSVHFNFRRYVTYNQQSSRSKYEGYFVNNATIILVQTFQKLCQHKFSACFSFIFFFITTFLLTTKSTKSNS